MRWKCRILNFWSQNHQVFFNKFFPPQNNSSVRENKNAHSVLIILNVERPEAVSFSVAYLRLFVCICVHVHMEPSTAIGYKNSWRKYRIFRSFLNLIIPVSTIFINRRSSLVLFVCYLHNWGKFRYCLTAIFLLTDWLPGSSTHSLTRQSHSFNRTLRHSLRESPIHQAISFIHSFYCLLALLIFITRLICISAFCISNLRFRVHYAQSWTTESL